MEHIFGEQYELGMDYLKIATPSTSPATIHAEFINGSLGLLNGNASPYNAADVETNQEMVEILRRKEKRKQGIRL